MISVDINVKVGIKGRYRLSVVKDGAVSRETPWFDNLITDLGMDQMGISTTWYNYCQVGSSSTSPSFSDTQLGSRIAGVSFASSSFRIESGSRYAVYTTVYEFLAGSAAGNIAEVGVSNNLAGTQLSSRARVQDSGGSPTTITVLSDEDLVVVWEFWVKQPETDFTSTASGKTITIRSAMVNATSGEGSWQSGPTIFHIAPVGFDGKGYAYTGTIGAITARPAGTSYAATSVATNAYSNGSYTRSGRLNWNTSTANAAIRSFAWVFGRSSWQCQLDTALPTKTNTQTLRLDVSITWSRDSGPA